MKAFRTLLCLVIASAFGLPLAAQTAASPSFSWHSGWQSASRTSLGLNVSHSLYQAPCGATSLLCDSSDRVARLYARTMVGSFWGVEVGYLDLGRLGATSETRTQGLNLSVIGKAPLGQSLGVFGKVGTTYGRSDTSVLGAGPDLGFGLSYGAGLSYAFTQRLSATLEWDSNDLRFGIGRDPVRSTSLGLQYKY